MTGTYARLHDQNGQPTDVWGVRILTPPPEARVGVVLTGVQCAKRDGTTSVHNVRVHHIATIKNVPMAFCEIVRDGQAAQTTQAPVVQLDAAPAAAQPLAPAAPLVPASATGVNARCLSCDGSGVMAVASPRTPVAPTTPSVPVATSVATPAASTPCSDCGGTGVVASAPAATALITMSMKWRDNRTVGIIATIIALAVVIAIYLYR